MRIILMLLFWMGLILPAVAQVRLPDPTQAMSSPGMEKMAGVLFSRRFESGFGGQKAPILSPEDPRAVRVQKIVDRLGQAVSMDRPNMVFQVKVVDQNEVNAFCIPGGYIYVYTGLLDHIQRNHPGDPDDALAAVLGHEIAHAVLRHGLQSWSQAEDFEAVLTDPATFEKLLLAASRAQEHEADRYGALYSLRAGFRFSAAMDIFEKFPKTREILLPGPSSHPEGKDRVAHLEKYRQQLQQMVRLWDEALAAASSGNYDSAAVAFEIVEAEFPNLPSVHNNLGWVYYQTYEKSLTEKRPQQLSYSYVSDLGIRLRGAGGDTLTLREAGHAFRQAIQLNPDMAEAYEGAALCALEQENYQEAEALLQQAIKLAPDRPSVLNLLGVLRESENKLQDAAAAYERATRADRAFLPAVYNLGAVQQRLGQTAAARATLERYLAASSPGYWKTQAERLLGAPGAVAEKTPPAIREAAGVKLGDSPEEVASVLGDPRDRVALPTGTELRTYQGLEVWLSPGGVSMIALKESAAGTVDGIQVGAGGDQVQQLLGPPSLRRPGDRGLEHWSYPARGYVLGMRDGEVVEILIGAAAR
ncbi:MAG: M48 family metalloprotease [Armatimonadetes bacterium]|nr:M48 family metalloprotease [Armatimonadota bacterium]